MQHTASRRTAFQQSSQRVPVIEITCVANEEAIRVRAMRKRLLWILEEAVVLSWREARIAMAAGQYKRQLDAEYDQHLREWISQRVIAEYVIDARGHRPRESYIVLPGRIVK